MITAYQKAYIKASMVASIGNQMQYFISYPIFATDSQILDYSHKRLNSSRVDLLLNALFSDGFCTNCIIDVSHNSIPTAASSAAITGLEAAGNVVIKDSI